MPDKTPHLGDELDIHCRFCHLNLNGTVSALMNGAIAKVKCRTCGNFQDYKPPMPEVDRHARLVKKAMRLADRRTSHASSIEPAKVASLSPEEVMRRLWDEATQDVNPLKVAVYSQHKTFKEHDILTHSKFGMGVIQEVAEDCVVVLFREGFQRLDHARPREEDE